MSLYHRDAAKTDPRNAKTWQFVCQDCGTPFESDVNTCPDCGNHDIVPIERVTTIETDDQ